jgi:hypothetical protein
LHHRADLTEPFACLGTAELTRPHSGLKKKILLRINLFPFNAQSRSICTRYLRPTSSLHDSFTIGEVKRTS